MIEIRTLLDFQIFIEYLKNFQFPNTPLQEASWTKYLKHYKELQKTRATMFGLKAEDLADPEQHDLFEMGLF